MPIRKCLDAIFEIFVFFLLILLLLLLLLFLLRSNLASMKDHKFNYSLYFISIFSLEPINALNSLAHDTSHHFIYIQRKHTDTNPEQKKPPKTIDCIFTWSQHVRIFVFARFLFRLNFCPVPCPVQTKCIIVIPSFFFSGKKSNPKKLCAA